MFRLFVDLDKTLICQKPNDRVQSEDPALLHNPVKVSFFQGDVCVFKRPGAEKFLLQCSKLPKHMCKVYLFTAGAKYWQKKVLQSLGWIHYFDGFFWRHDQIVKDGKPVKSLASLGFDNPDDTLVLVDDSPRQAGANEGRCISVAPFIPFGRSAVSLILDLLHQSTQLQSVFERIQERVKAHEKVYVEKKKEREEREEKERMEREMKEKQQRKRKRISEREVEVVKKEAVEWIMQTHSRRSWEARKKIKPERMESFWILTEGGKCCT